MQGNRADATRHIERQPLIGSASRKKDDVARVAPHVRHLNVENLCPVEKNVLRQTETDCQLTFDGDLLRRVVGQVPAGGVDVEVDLLVIVTADEERPAKRVETDFKLAGAGRRLLRR